MAAQVGVAGVYIVGAALVGGAVYLMTPQGRRTSESLGEAIIDGGSAAVDNIADLFSSDEEESGQATTTTTTTSDVVERCDGPHRGRLQVQGYDERIDPFDFTSNRGPSWAWNEPCYPPLRSMGLAQLSTNLLVQTRNIRFEFAGLRAAAFTKMSQHITKAPPTGFYARHVIGWNHLGQRALGSGRNVPRVDLEVIQGRAFGDR